MFTVSDREDGFNYSPILQSLSLLTIRTFVNINGLNEWNARIMPALIGIGSIPVLFFITRKFFDIPTALLAALLLALSPWHLYWSQSARFYTTLLLFYSLALFYFYLGLEHDKPGYLALCLIFLGLAVKERLLALFFLPVIFAYLACLWLLVFEKPKGWNVRNLILFVLPVLFGGLLFSWPYLQNLSGWFSGFGYANNNPLWLAGGFVFYVGLPVICLGSIGGLHLVIQKDRTGLLLSISALLPILMLSAISPFHYTANRYAFLSLTSWLILAAVSVILLINKSTDSSKLLPAGVLLILLIQPMSDNALYYLYQNGNRDDWKAAFAYVAQHRRPDDRVASGDTYLAQYYLREGTIYFGDVRPEEIEAGGERAWFVEDMANAEKFPALHTWLADNTQLVSIHDVNFLARTFTMRVYLYEPEMAQPEGGLLDDR